MSKSYKQLREEERDKLASLRDQGKSLREMAVILGRSPSTLSREFRRNSSKGCEADYLPHAAHHLAAKRKGNHARARLPNKRLRAYARRQLRRRWSPERIAGRWKLLGNPPVSHETIYQWVYAESRELIPFLPRAHRKRLPRGHRLRKQLVSFIPSRKMLAERPKFIEKRRQVGHWEADLVLGRHSASAIQILIERSSRYARVRKLPARQAVEVRRAITRSLAQYPKHLRRTITYDNGRENVQHQLVNKALGTRSYFCTPMHSWEKGSVENLAGLVRRFFPKPTDFAMVSSQKIKETERWLNGLPRKCLGFKTSAEVFRQSVALTT